MPETGLRLLDAHTLDEQILNGKRFLAASLLRAHDPEFNDQLQAIDDIDERNQTALEYGAKILAAREAEIGQG